eukprot:CAMPEP_0204616022 /NCGR_PEP_ID=MMETSP0717-20131115/3364_1 /ASSEMBLY_ACC=CAM_ASM_000666 /TAXON_ID=230516 /ORGANISM="Chaetoceros curvisetus" /LENGTH=195 /DNA_ID=CAMNT_0051629117 /DNA_START=276 /DNA_END=863 /DNA_ORIENTATION=+
MSSCVGDGCNCSEGNCGPDGPENWKKKKMYGLFGLLLIPAVGVLAEAYRRWRKKKNEAKQDEVPQAHTFPTDDSVPNTQHPDIVEMPIPDPSPPTSVADEAPLDEEIEPEIEVTVDEEDPEIQVVPKVEEDEEIEPEIEVTVDEEDPEIVAPKVEEDEEEPEIASTAETMKKEDDESEIVVTSDTPKKNAPNVDV